MKLEDIIGSLTFREEKWTEDTTVMICELIVSRRTVMRNDLLLSYRDPKHLQRSIKEMLKSQILNDLYDDQGKEHLEAILDFCSVNPVDSMALQKARSRVLKLAQYQPPKEYASSK